MVRRLCGLIFGAAAIVSATASIESWLARPAAVAAPPRAPEPVLSDADLGAPPIVLDDAVFAEPAEPPDRLSKNEGPAARPEVIGRTATGLELYVGPRGGIYHLSKSGRKVYHGRTAVNPEDRP